MRQTPTSHPHEDVFEEYVFERLTDPQSTVFEEHLLICEECQNTLEGVTEYIRLMKAATSAYAVDRPRIPAPQMRFRSHGLRRNAATAAVLLLMCITALLSWRTPPADPQTVGLEAYRAGDPSTVPQAPAGRPLDLKIDLKDLPPATGYRVEVVDSSGRRVWFGGTPARLNKGLARGSYWIRLYAETGELLREFGLHAG
jgi:hypothetical protein